MEVTGEEPDTDELVVVSFEDVNHLWINEVLKSLVDVGGEGCRFSLIKGMAVYGCGAIDIGRGSV